MARKPKTRYEQATTELGAYALELQGTSDSIYSLAATLRMELIDPTNIHELSRHASLCAVRDAAQMLAAKELDAQDAKLEREMKELQAKLSAE
jgi:hypothetical protein